jgi:hypothetical protein
VSIIDASSAFVLSAYLIRELGAVDGLASSTITTGEVTTLDHELLDNTVERRSWIIQREFFVSS